MKFLGVVLGVMISSACTGGTGEPTKSSDPDESDEVVGADAAASSFENLRTGHGDRGYVSPAVRRAIAGGAARLTALQADTTGDNAGNGLNDIDPDDGGWDFTIAASATGHTAAPSPTNLFGETGLGAWAAVDSRISGPRVLVTALDAGTGMQRNPDIDSPPDFVFGVLLAELADNPGFAEIARQHYDAKLVTFGRAVGLGTTIRDVRHAGHEDGLIAYDLGWLILSAVALDSVFPNAGYDTDANTYAGIVVDDLTSATPRFDFRDPTEGFYVTGLAWSQVASAQLGARALFRQVRNQLLDEQHADGAWGDSAAHPADDLQSTAYALQTLALTDRSTPRSRRAERRAAGFLVRAQAASGGWSDATNVELPLVDADIVLGLMLSQTEAGEDGLAPDSPLAADSLVTTRTPAAAPLP